LKAEKRSSLGYDCTNFPREIVEAALARTIDSEVERAYRRGTALDQRRRLMGALANYCDADRSNPA